MKGYSEVAALVPYTMDAKLVGHIGDSTFLIRLLGYYLHGRWLYVGVREGVSGLSQVASEDLHEAVGVAMVMDGAALARRPYEHELCLHELRNGASAQG